MTDSADEIEIKICMVGLLIIIVGCWIVAFYTSVNPKAYINLGLMSLFWFLIQYCLDEIGRIETMQTQRISSYQKK